MKRDRKTWFVWMIEYRADNGGWYPVIPWHDIAIFDLRYQAEKAVAVRYGKEAGYRVSRYVRQEHGG